MAMGDESRDGETSESPDFSEAFLEPGPRRSTYTPPPFVKPSGEDAPASEEDAEKVPGDDRPVFDLDDPGPYGAAPASSVPSGFEPPAPWAQVPSMPPPPADEGLSLAERLAAQPPPSVPPASGPVPPPEFEAQPFPGPAFEVPPFEVPQFDSPTAESGVGDSPSVVVPAPPERQSLTDADLVERVESTVAESGSAGDAIAELERQLKIREDEAREYLEWEESMLAVGTPEAIAAVDEVRPHFEEVVTSSILLPTGDEGDPPIGDATVEETPREGAPIDAELGEPVTAAPVAEPSSDEMPFDPPPFDDAPFDPPPFDDAPFDPPPFDDAPFDDPEPAAREDLWQPPPLVEPPAFGAQRFSAPWEPGGPAEVFAEADPESQSFDEAPTADATDDRDEVIEAPEFHAPVAEELPSVEPAEPEPAEPVAADAEPVDISSLLRSMPPPAVSPFADLPAPSESTGFGGDVAPMRFLEPSQPIDVIPSPEFARLLADPTANAQPEAFVAPVVVPAPAVSPFAPEDLGALPTPAERRVGRAVQSFWLWFAANASVVSIAFGAVLFSLGTSVRQAVIATVAGLALSAIPLGVGALAARRSGQPTMVVSRATFGIRGNILPAVVALVSRIFWGAALLWFLGMSVASILVGADLTGGLGHDQLVLLGMGVGFVFALVAAFAGFGVIAKLQLVVAIVSAVLIVGVIALTWQYVDFATALSVQDGSSTLILTGAVLVFSFIGLVWAQSGGDLARYQRPGGSAGGTVAFTSVGAVLPPLVLIGYGALLAASDPTIAAGLTTDPLDTIGRMLPLWYPAPLIAAAALSLLSGVVVSVYSGSFAVAAIGLRMKQTVSTLFVAILVFLFGWIISSLDGEIVGLFRDLATTVAVPVAAWAGIFAADMVIRRKRFDSASLLTAGGRYPTVRVVNVVALVVISAVGWGLTTATLAGLGWQGFLLQVAGLPLDGELAQSDLGVLVALVLGLLVGILGGSAAVRQQELDEATP